MPIMAPEGSRHSQLRCVAGDDEEITLDVPSDVSDSALADLDDHGVVREGARVRPGDILVGKVAPIDEAELSPEQAMLMKLFGRGSQAVDASLRVPDGLYGTVVSRDLEIEGGVVRAVTVTLAEATAEEVAGWPSKDEGRDALALSLDSLSLSVRLANELGSLGLVTVGDVAAQSKRSLRAGGLSIRAERDLDALLAELQITLQPDDAQVPEMPCVTYEAPALLEHPLPKERIDALLSALERAGVAVTRGRPHSKEALDDLRKGRGVFPRDYRELLETYGGLSIGEEGRFSVAAEDHSSDVSREIEERLEGEDLPSNATTDPFADGTAQALMRSLGLTEVELRACERLRPDHASANPLFLLETMWPVFLREDFGREPIVFDRRGYLRWAVVKEGYLSKPMETSFSDVLIEKLSELLPDEE